MKLKKNEIKKIEDTFNNMASEINKFKDIKIIMGNKILSVRSISRLYKASYKLNYYINSIIKKLNK